MDINEHGGHRAHHAEDTFDADYGRLLERAHSVVTNRKWVASPTGVVPEWTREVPGEVKVA